MVAVAPGYRSTEVLVTLSTGELSSSLLLEGQPAASIHGNVRVEGHTCSDGFISASGPVSANVRVSKAGTADLHGLPAGTYEVLVSCAGAELHSEVAGTSIQSGAALDPRSSTVPTVRVKYERGKGPAAGGLAQVTGRNAQGSSVCVATDTTIDSRSASNTCSSAPVSILGVVD